MLLPPGRDASPLQGYPQPYVAGTHLYNKPSESNGHTTQLRGMASTSALASTVNSGVDDLL